LNHLSRRAVPDGPIVPQGRLATALAQVADPRRPFGWHPDHPPLPLVAILLLTVAALLGGATTITAVAQWGRDRLSDHPDLLLAFGFPPGQSPSVTTLHRLYRRLDVTQAALALQQWAHAYAVAVPEVVALDGQTEVHEAGGWWQTAEHQSRKAQHGRTEWRRICALSDPRLPMLLGRTSHTGACWAMIQQVVRVERRRWHWRRGQCVKTTHEVVYFLVNRPLPAERLATLIRGHWGIENHLHRQRDELLGQDRSTIRSGSAPALWITLRNLILTILAVLHAPNAAAQCRTWAARPLSVASLVLRL
jgi:predicted transposase YbfD/YdcC